MFQTDAWPELGAAISLDHFNSRVPEHGPATAFFIEGLGFTRDPYRMVGTSNMWVNVGRQQIHLPIGPPVPFPGEVGLVVPDLDEVRERLRQLESKLSGTAFGWSEAGDDLRATSPWGVAFRIHAAGSVPFGAPLGLSYVTSWMRPGSAAGVARFYSEALHCPVTRSRADGSERVAVAVGPYQTLYFVERGDVQIAPHNHHVALYVTHYQELYAAIQGLHAVMEADRGGQFRFNRIVDPASSETLVILEHEVRSLYHPDYGRPLVNRNYALA